MKQKIHKHIQKMAKDPKLKQAITSIKPEKNILGVLGVLVFFILPEFIAYFWGSQIAHYAHTQLGLSPSFMEGYVYKLLLLLFEEGVSWFNLTLGLALLVWLFF